MLTTAVITVTTSPTLLAAASGTRDSLRIRNADAAAVVKIGKEDVTFATGFGIKAGDTIPFQNGAMNREASAAFYGIATAGTVSVEVISYQTPPMA